MDADGSHDAADIPKLALPLIRGEADRHDVPTCVAAQSSGPRRAHSQGLGRGPRISCHNRRRRAYGMATGTILIRAYRADTRPFAFQLLAGKAARTSGFARARDHSANPRLLG